MKKTKILLGACAALALAGCTAVREARKAQSEVKDKGSGVEADTWIAPKVDLAGVPLRGLVEFALTNRPSMVSAALNVKDARLAMKAIAADAPLASATPWNAVDASANIGYSESSKAAHFDHIKSKTYKSKASGSISLDLLIWDFGRNSARAKAQAENVVSAEVELAKQGYQVLYDVTSSYFELLTNDALLEAAHTNVFEYAERLARTELRWEQGEVKELDLLKSRLDLAKAEEQLANASNSVVTAEADLMAALGIDSYTGSAKSVLGARTIPLDAALRAFPDTTATSPEIFDFACTNAPVMQIARAKLRAASHDVDYAIADLGPSISASVSASWTDPLWIWNWGFSAVQSLFSGFSKTTALERATVAMETAAADVDSTEQQLSYDIALAVAERDNAKTSVATSLKAALEAKKNLDTVKSQFDVGDVSRSDFTDAIGDYTAELGNLIEAFYRGQTAEVKLLQLQGVEPEWIMEKLESFEKQDAAETAEEEEGSKE